jgi:hypothetical protein
MTDSLADLSLKRKKLRECEVKNKSVPFYAFIKTYTRILLS